MSQFSATDDLTAIASALSGQYQVEREIGRGGMGVVYLARDLRLDRLVAIKTLLSGLADDVAFRERFLREARTAGRLSHPNIVPIHRADEIGGQVFFVMGFVDGDSLAARLAAGPLSPRDAVPILLDVASALGYAHTHGVVHRDVKTENILLQAGTGRAMVTDFGIARLAEAAPLTATGQVLGTVYYLSPEQVTGDDVDARSDIYALGVVGYAMLAGRFPFDAPLASAVLVAHVMKQPAPLSIVASHVPASLATIIDRCLAKNPAHRFQTCADLEAALVGAQSEASRVVVTARKTPLVSDTEAHQLLKRAAELENMTGVQPRAAVHPVMRDADSDAKRTSGFKTSDLREAAAEAGIGAEHVERALAERGLRPPNPRRPDRRPPDTLYDLRRKARFGVEATVLPYEMVINGEMPEEDYDLLVDVIQRHIESDGLTGMGSSVGGTFSWSGRTRNGRTLDISVTPRLGKTTIRVSESIKQIAQVTYGLGVGAGGVGVGFLTFASMIAHGDGGVAAFIVLPLLFASFVGASAVVNKISETRRKALEALVAELGAQARESVASSK